jgi:hypothetical protein
MVGKLMKAQKLLVLAAMVAADGILDGAKLKLFKSDTQISPTMVVGDLTEANFPGYAAATPANWGTPFYRNSQEAVIVHESVQFTPNATVTTEQKAYGYYLTNAAGSTLIYAERFDEEVDMLDATTAVIVQPTVVYGS